MLDYLLKKWGIFSQTENRKGFREILLASPLLNMGMDVRISPFLGISDSFAKLHPKIGILSEWESRVPRTIQRTNQTEP